MSSDIVIPAGKRVRFKIGGREAPGTEGVVMLLESDVSISMSSSFSSVSGGRGGSSSPQLLTLLSGVMRDSGLNRSAGWVGGQWKQLGFQTWSGTQPLTTTITINLYMEEDAKKEVLEPAMALARLCLPSEVSGGALVPPGPSIISALEGSIETEDSIESGRIIHCYIGNFVMRNVIILKAEPTFSREIDDRGFPIAAKVDISISTIFSATTQMLDDILEQQ